MLNKKGILATTIFLFLLLLVAGCKNLVPKQTKGLIFGRILIPPTCEHQCQCKDISGWMPAVNAWVSIKDVDGVVHKVCTDKNGNFSFENLSVNSFTIVTALIEYPDDTNTILKGVIPIAVSKDDNYDVEILTPESTALALVIEKLLEQGKSIDLYSIKRLSILRYC